MLVFALPFVREKTDNTNKLEGSIKKRVGGLNGGEQSDYRSD